MLRQHLAGAAHHFLGQAGKLGDLDSIAAVGGAGRNLSQEYDTRARLLYRDVVVLHSGELLGQFRELEIMSSKQRLGAGAGVEILDRRPCDGQSIIGCRAATDLIEKNE